MKASSDTPPAFQESSWPPLAAASVIIVLTLAAYASSFTGVLILDDTASILKNPSIRHFGTAFFPPHGSETVAGRPLLNFSLALNYACGGTRVWGYHALNLLIHTLTGLTLFGIVRRTLLRPGWRERFGPAATPLALAAALLWTLHPLQTEAVTYVIQRAESLMALFYLLTLYGFIRATEGDGGGKIEPPPSKLRGKKNAGAGRARNPAIPKPTPSPSASRWKMFSLAACLLGMMSKEVMVSAPVMVLLFDRTFVAGTFGRALRARRGYYLGLAATWLLLAGLVAAEGNRGGSAGFGIGIGWLTYVLTQFRAVATYLQLTVWPRPLIFMHEVYWTKSAWDVAPYAAVVAALVAATLVALKRRPAAGFCGFWFCAILAPTSLIPGNTQMIVEHRMYLALAALTAPAVLVIWQLAGRRGLAAVFIVAIGLGLATARRNADYHSPFLLWNDTVAKCPDSAVARNGLGHALYTAGRTAEAIGECRAALKLWPDYPMARTTLGAALIRAGRLDEATEQFQAALRIDPTYPDAHNDLGALLVYRERYPEAIVHYQAALRLRPDLPEAHYGLGVSLAATGHAAEAIGEFQTTLRLDPDFAAARDRLAELKAPPSSDGSAKTAGSDRR